MSTLILLIILSSTLYSQVYQDLTTQECTELIEDYEGNSKFTLLDVRTPAEYDPEHLAGAFNRDFYDDDFKEQLDSLDKSRIYLIYCRSGNRSGQTLDLVEELEFDTVYNMLGGITQWKQDGYPVTDAIPDYVDIYANVTSTLESELESYNIYPNPTGGYLKTDFDIRSNLMLYNFSGMKIKSGYRILENRIIDISELSSGIYILISNVNGVKITKEFIKL